MAISFTVSPMMEKISLKAGEVYEGLIRVANPKTAAEDFYYKIDISPYFVAGEDYTPDFETMSEWSSIVNWTTIEDTEGVLKPNETRAIKYRIEVPKNAPAGGQYLKIGVTSNAPVSENEGGVVQNVYELASLVFASIEGDVVHGGRILDGEVPSFETNEKPAVMAKFTNTGNVHEIATTSLLVKNFFGGEIIYPKDGETSEQESVIMPLSTRVISRQIPNLPALGVFEVKQTVSYMGEVREFSSIMVVCPIWFVVLVLAFLVSLAGMFFYGRHLRRKKSKKPLHSEQTNAKIEP